MSTKSNYPITWIHEKHENVFVGGMQKNKLPPLEILKWLFRYDSDTGKLFKIRGSSGNLCNPEREITYVGSNGYLQVKITDSNGLMKLFVVHQLIYYMVSSEEPLSIVDHIDGNPLDNRFNNLRLATESLNSRNKRMLSNNTSGVCGVCWYKITQKWMAYVSDATGKQKNLGYFVDKDEAIAVVSAFYANPELGYSERHGLPLGC